MKLKFSSNQKRYQAMCDLNKRHIGRAKKAGVKVDATPSQLIRIISKQKGRCCYCYCRVDNLTLDHITPISKGGDHTAKNIAFACDQCNNRKSNRDPFDFKKNGFSAIFILNFIK